MKWNKFTLKTRSEVEDIVISTLADVGIEGVEIQDTKDLNWKHSIMYLSES